jgi:DNA-binding NtrC family response regulator
MDPETERGLILKALEEAAGNQSRASRILGISRRTLVNRLDEYGLKRPQKGHDEDD